MRMILKAELKTTLIYWEWTILRKLVVLLRFQKKKNN